MDIKGFFLKKPLQRGNRYILVGMTDSTHGRNDPYY